MTVMSMVRTAGLAAAGLIALTVAASAGTVRVTIAEYSKGTGPYFEAQAKAFEAANPDTEIQIEVVPWDSLQQKLTTDISGRHQCRSRHHRHALAGRLSSSRAWSRPLDDHMTRRVQGPLHRDLPVALGARRQDLRPADRRLGARHVLQQGHLRESRHHRAAEDLG